VTGLQSVFVAMFTTEAKQLTVQTSELLTDCYVEAAQQSTITWCTKYLVRVV